MPIERLQALDNVEKEIASCVQIAGILLLKNLIYSNWHYIQCLCFTIMHIAIRNGSTGTQQRQSQHEGGWESYFPVLENIEPCWRRAFKAHKLPHPSFHR